MFSLGGFIAGALIAVTYIEWPTDPK